MDIISFYFSFILCINDYTSVISEEINITGEFIEVCQIYPSYIFSIIGMLKTLFCQYRCKIFFP